MSLFLSQKTKKGPWLMKLHIFSRHYNSKPSTSFNLVASDHISSNAGIKQLADRTASDEIAVVRCIITLAGAVS